MDKWRLELTAEEIGRRLGLIEEPFSAEEKEKLESLFNYDDTELKEIIRILEENLEAATVDLDNKKADKLNTYTKEQTETLVTDKTKLVREEITIESDNAELVFEKLKENNKEYLCRGGTVKSITFTKLKDGEELSNDYWALFILNKSEEVSEIAEIILNTDIKLINPDLDISEYSILHLLFNYDGINLCCIAAGY